MHSPPSSDDRFSVQEGLRDIIGLPLAMRDLVRQERPRWCATSSATTTSPGASPTTSTGSAPTSYLRRERRAEGIAAAKQRGAYRGRPPKIDMEAITDRLVTGQSPTQIARTEGLARGTVGGQDRLCSASRHGASRPTPGPAIVTKAADGILGGQQAVATAELGAGGLPAVE